MNEDENLNAEIKKAFESGVHLSDETLDSILAAAEAEKRRSTRGRRLRFGAFLTAASIVAAMAFSVFFADRDGNEDLSGVIELLASVDGVDLRPVDDRTSAGLLLAWQEAPLEAGLHE